MGLLARANKEAEGSKSLPADAVVRRPAGNSPPPLDAARAMALIESLPGKADVLAIRFRYGTSPSGHSSPRMLSDALSLALGPDASIFDAAGQLLCFSAPRGDWDPEIFGIQLKHSLASTLGRESQQGLSMRIVKFARLSVRLKEELVAFADG